MKRLIFLITISILFINSTLAQNKWNIRSNAGIASAARLVDGYYFSFDIGIPLSRSLELTPTFTSVSMLPNSYIDNSWDEVAGVSYVVDADGPSLEKEYGDNLSSISLLIQFDPFALMQSEKLKKHELILGTGISYNSYTMISSRFDIQDGAYELINFSVKSNRNFELYYFKLSYNYLFKENLFLGGVLGLLGFDNEAILLAGVQFGVKI